MPSRPSKVAITGRNISSSTIALTKTSDSPIPYTSEATKAFSEYFDDQPVPSHKFNFDTQALLSARSDDLINIKTIQKQIWEITGDGKMIVIPNHCEHILFEDHMYLCTHVFGDASGKKVTEVYLWAGDNVPHAAIEDAQLFSRKIARENSAKL